MRTRVRDWIFVARRPAAHRGPEELAPTILFLLSIFSTYSTAPRSWSMAAGPPSSAAAGVTNAPAPPTPSRRPGGRRAWRELPRVSRSGWPRRCSRHHPLLAQRSVQSQRAALDGALRFVLAVAATGRRWSCSSADSISPCPAVITLATIIARVLRRPLLGACRWRIGRVALGRSPRVCQSDSRSRGSASAARRHPGSTRLLQGVVFRSPRSVDGGCSTALARFARRTFSRRPPRDRGESGDSSPPVIRHDDAGAASSRRAPAPRGPPVGIRVRRTSSRPTCSPPSFYVRRASSSPAFSNARIGAVAAICCRTIAASCSAAPRSREAWDVVASRGARSSSRSCSSRARHGRSPHRGVVLQ